MIDAKKRALELALLAARLDELGWEARQTAGLESVSRRIFSVKGRVLEIAGLLRQFSRTGPDNQVDAPR